MEPNESIEITRVANGFIVGPVGENIGGNGDGNAEALVFVAIDDLFSWLRIVHFPASPGSDRDETDR